MVDFKSEDLAKVINIHSSWIEAIGSTTTSVNIHNLNVLSSIPVICLLFLTAEARSSVIMAKRREARGQLCCVPLINLKIYDWIPLIFMIALESKQRTLVVCRKFCPNPICLIVSNMKLHNY